MGPRERKWFVKTVRNGKKFPICKNNEQRQKWWFLSTGTVRILRKDCPDGGMIHALRVWGVNGRIYMGAGMNIWSQFFTPCSSSIHLVMQLFSTSFRAHHPYPVPGGSGRVICIGQQNANRHMRAEVRVCLHSSTCSLAHVWFSVVKICLGGCWFKERVETHGADQNQSWILETYPLDL